MSVKITLSSGSKKLGPAPYSMCPSCVKKPPLHMFYTFLTPRVYHIPTLHLRGKVTALCPHCLSTFEVEQRKAKELRKNMSALVLPKDLLHRKVAGENPLFQVNFTSFG